MKTTLRRSRLVAPTLILVLASGCGGDGGSQGTGPENFAIRVGLDGSGVELTCERGCAWRTLGFGPLGIGEAKAVDNYGMTGVDRARTEDESAGVPFRFTVERTEQGVRLTGVDGTAWRELAFSCRPRACNQAIDRNGMT